MEYTVKDLGKIAGISTRTLRYYDEIGILKPARINSSGYRIYGEHEINRLQQILFYKELDVSLENIKKIISESSFDEVEALKEHRAKLIKKRKQLDLLISNVEKTIDSKEGSVKMTDKEKFEGFKEKMVDDNEKKYGKEIREKYGKDTVEKSNEKVMKMTKENHKKTTDLTEKLMTTLAKALIEGNPASELAQKVAELHKAWLMFYWSEYSKEAHAGLAQMYVEDERFKAYYDQEQPGTAAFLRDAILIYTGMDKQ